MAVSKKQIKTIAFLGLALIPIIAVVHFLSDRYPDWLRNFAHAVTYPFEGEGNAPKGRALVCMRDFTPFEWDRFFVAEPGKDMADYPAFKELTWEDDDYQAFESLLKVMESTMLAFSKDNKVIWFSYLPKFTKSRVTDNQIIVFPGARGDGYIPLDAVFSIENEGDFYRLSAVENPATVRCNKVL